MKKPRRRKVSNARVNVFKSRDEAVEGCRSIMVLADLLEGCDVEFLNPQTISHTGGIIFHHARKLQERLEMLYQQLQKAK